MERPVAPSNLLHFCFQSVIFSALFLNHMLPMGEINTSALDVKEAQGLD